MRPLSTAIFSRLSGDATLTALLGKTATVPSIFTKRPIPTGAGYPLVIVGPVVSDQHADAISSVGRQIAIDVSVHGKAADQYNATVDAAERIRALLHRSKVTPSGWQSVVIVCSGPIDAPAEPDEISRVVTANVRLHQV